MFQARKNIESRKSDRIETQVEGRCTSQRGFEWQIQYRDLSPGGCRVDDPRHGLDLGAIVRLEIAGTGPHHAEVAWRQGDRVGLEFVTELPLAVFRHLIDGEWEEAQAADRNQPPALPVRRVI